MEDEATPGNLAALGAAVGICLAACAGVLLADLVKERLGLTQPHYPVMPPAPKEPCGCEDAEPAPDADPPANVPEAIERREAE